MSRSEQNAVERQQGADLVIAALLAGWTQGELADLLNTAPGTVKGWEKGRNRASNAARAQLQEIARTPRFRKSATELLSNARAQANHTALLKGEELAQLMATPVDPARYGDPLLAGLQHGRRIAALEHAVRMATRRSRRLDAAVKRAKPAGLIAGPSMKSWDPADEDDPRSGSFGRKDER